MDSDELRLEAQDLNQQGAMLLKAGNLEAARAKFDKAIELDPMLMDSYKNYGDLYMALEEYQNAKNSYKKAMLIEKMGILYFLYGNACFMNDEFQEGIEYYNLAIHEGYNHDRMMFFMGMAYEQMHDDDMALRYFQKAYIKNPTQPDYLIKKIGVLIRLGMYESAFESTEELLVKSPEMFDGYHIKTQLLIINKEYKKAIAFAKAASEKFPEDIDLLYDYAKALSLANELDEAIKVIELAKTMKYYKESKRPIVLLEGEIYAEKNNYEKAIECCKECIALESESGFDSEARFILINLYLTEPNYKEAYNQTTEIIEKDPKSLYYYAALYYRAYCLRQLGEIDKSLELYNEANTIYRLATLKNPAAIDIYLYRAMCLKDIKKYDDALELLEYINNLSDQIAEVHTLRADIYNLTGREGLAKEELNKAYMIKPELRETLENKKGGDA